MYLRNVGPKMRRDWEAKYPYPAIGPNTHSTDDFAFQASGSEHGSATIFVGATTTGLRLYCFAMEEDRQKFIGLAPGAVLSDWSKYQK